MSNGHNPRRLRRGHRDGQVNQPAPDVHIITNAVEPLDVDQARRMRRYLIQMTIRVLCFVAAFLAYTYYPKPWLILVFITAAAVLPYIAVVGVNAGRERPAAHTVPMAPVALLDSGISIVEDPHHQEGHPSASQPQADDE